MPPMVSGPSQGFRPPAGQNPLLMDDAPAPQPQPQQAQQPFQAQQTPIQGYPGAQQAPGQPQQAPAQQAPVQQPPQTPEMLDFGGRRVEVPADPNLAAAFRMAHQEYQMQRRQLTRVNQQMSQFQQQAPQAQPQPQPQQQDYQPQGQPQAQPAGQGLNIEAAVQQAIAGVNSEEWMPTFYADPGKALGGLMQSALAPIIQRFESQLSERTRAANQYVEQQQTAEALGGELQGMASRPDLFPDMEQLKPIMAQIIDQAPHLVSGPNPMQTIYRMARGYMPGGQAQPMTVESVLGNQQLAGQLMAHPAIRDQVIRSYVEAIRQGQPPVNLSAPPGGVSPALPEQRPRSIKEAGRMALGWLNSAGG